ncbi:MAG TPA: DUF4173 domain-containing protein [Mycobacteriales bacterium]|nr:DUF4173 domain-containing protein [Mycobacteriales bacterium]
MTTFEDATFAVRPDAPPAVPVAAVLAALLSGVAFDLMARRGVVTVSGALFFGCAGVAVAAVPRDAARSARVVGLLAAACGVVLALRTSAWVTPLSLLAALGLVVVSVVLHRGGDLFDLTAPRLVARSVTAALDALRLPGPVLRWLRAVQERAVGQSDNRRRLTTYARSVLIALVVLLVVAPLLAAGDAVFASLVSVDVDLGSAPGHLVLVALGAAGTGAVLFAASGHEAAPRLPSAPTLGRAEARAAVGALVGVYAMFAGVQVVAVSGGADRVLRTAGLTYAEYARSGYFQLLAAVAVTLLVLLGVRALRASAEPDAALRRLSVVACALTVVCVATAVRRLALYEHAFGLTMLRLYVLVSAAWLGAVLGLVAVALAGTRSRRQWLPGAVLVTTVGFLLTLAVVNPEALVVRRNVARAEAGRSLDVTYLASLSSDAVPAIVDSLPRLAPDDRALLMGWLCADYRFDVGTGWAANMSERRAKGALAPVC